MAAKLARVSFHKITKSFDHVVVQGYVNYFCCYITTTTRPMATELTNLLAYHTDLL